MYQVESPGSRNKTLGKEILEMLQKCLKFLLSGTIKVLKCTFICARLTSSFCPQDGPRPPEPHLHLFAGPTTHHRGGLLAGKSAPLLPF